MGVIQRESIASSFYQVLGVVLSSIQLLFIFPALLKPEELGLIRLFIDVSFVIAPLFLLGSGSAFVKFYFKLKDSLRLVLKLKLWAVLVNTIGFIVFTSFVFLVLPIIENWMIGSSPEFIPYLKLVPVLGFFVSVFQLFRSFHQVHMKIQLANILEFIVIKLLLIGLALAVYFVQLSYTQIVVGVIFGYFILTFIQVLVHFNEFPEERISLKAFDFTELPLKSLASYSIFTFFIAVTDGVVIKLDTWMISSLVSLEAVGVYAIAIQLGLLIEFPRRAIIQSVAPQLALQWAKNNMEEILNIYQRTSLIQLILGGLIFSLIVLNLDSFYQIIPNGKNYIEGKWVVVFIGLGKWFAIATGTNLEILQMSPHFKHSFWIRLSLLITAIVLNLIFIPMYGIVGAAMATASTFLLNNVTLSLLVWIILKIQPFSVKTLKALFVLIISALLTYLVFTFENPFFDVAVRSILYLTLSITSLYVLKVSDDMNRIMQNVLSIFTKS